MPIHQQWHWHYRKLISVTHWVGIMFRAMMHFHHQQPIIDSIRYMAPLINFGDTWTFSTQLQVRRQEDLVTLISKSGMVAGTNDSLREWIIIIFFLQRIRRI